MSSTGQQARHRFGASSSLAAITRHLLYTSLAGSLAAAPVAAQVVPGGPDAPSLDMSANGTPVVKIRTPNRGVSATTPIVTSTSMPAG